MDQQILMALGQYLNENLSLETCDNTLKNTVAYLKAIQYEDIEAEETWLEEQGVSCDCQVVLKLYLPAREEEVTSSSAD
jgi:hypothetical protein